MTLLPLMAIKYPGIYIKSSSRIENVCHYQNYKMCNDIIKKCMVYILRFCFALYTKQMNVYYMSHYILHSVIYIVCQYVTVYIFDNFLYNLLIYWWCKQHITLDHNWFHAINWWWPPAIYPIHYPLADLYSASKSILSIVYINFEIVE